MEGFTAPNHASREPIAGDVLRALAAIERAAAARLQPRGTVIGAASIALADAQTVLSTSTVVHVIHDAQTSGAPA